MQDEFQMIGEFKGTFGKIELYSDKVVIKRGGLHPEGRNQKAIYLSSITAIQVKKPGLEAGYIQFVLPGSQEVKKRGFMNKEIAFDENSVFFNSKAKYDEAMAFKNQIEKMMHVSHQPTVIVQNQMSIANELTQLKSLMDAGVLTEEEFAQQKQKMLGADRISDQKSENRAERVAQPVQKAPKQAIPQSVPQYTPQYTQQTTENKKESVVQPVQGAPEQCRNIHHNLPQPPEITPKQKPRCILQGISIFWLFGAAVMLLVGIITDPTAIIGGLACGILGGMFLVLSKTPKGSTYLFGKEKGIKKLYFVLACVVLFFVLMMLSPTPCQHEYTLTDTKAATCTKDGKETYICDLCEHKKYETLKATGHIIENGKCTVCGYVETKQDDHSFHKTNAKTTMADVQKWYEDQIPAISQSLSDYAKSVDDLTVLNVDSSKFRFGEEFGWYNCHYTMIFTCKVNGVSYRGEARAFVKYQDKTIHWFHFEIFSNSGATSLVEHYDDSYDQIIEDYYKELQGRYN